MYWVLTMYLTLISTLPTVFLLIFTKILRQVLLVPTFYRYVSWNSSRSGNLSEVTHLIAKLGVELTHVWLERPWSQPESRSIATEGFDAPCPPLHFHLCLAFRNPDFVLSSFPVIDNVLGILFVFNKCLLNEWVHRRGCSSSGFCTDLGWLLISFVKTQVIIMQRQ